MRNKSSRGFTLVELLVVIGILVVLAVMTLSLVNTTQNEDRVRAGAAQVQSFLEGARDRAIHAKEPRGVRFLFDTQDPDLVTSMLYIGPPENFAKGDISIDINQRTINFRQNPPGTFPLKDEWTALYKRGLIPTTGAVIYIFSANSKPEFYTMNVVGTDFVLTKDYSATATNLPRQYSLQLNPNVLPNQEPRQLPRDVVIDLDNSQLPNLWKGSTAGTYASQLDILFSPNGTVTGLVASAGVIHLLVAEGVDVIQGRGAGHYEKEGQERIVTLRTQTGGISVHHVDPTGATAANPTGAADPFKFAANGEPAK